MLVVQNFYGDLCKTSLDFGLIEIKLKKSLKRHKSVENAVARAYLTPVSPLSDAIGHNNPRCSVQVVGDSLHDVAVRAFWPAPHISMPRPAKRLKERRSLTCS